MTEGEIEQLRDAIREQRDEIRDALEAEGVDLGGWPDGDVEDEPE